MTFDPNRPACGQGDEWGRRPLDPDYGKSKPAPPFWYVRFLKPTRPGRILLNAIMDWQLGRPFWKSLRRARGYTH